MDELNSYLCDRCGKWVGLETTQEHQDYHVALDLYRLERVTPLSSNTANSTTTTATTTTLKGKQRVSTPILNGNGRLKGVKSRKIEKNLSKNTKLSDFFGKQT